MSIVTGVKARFGDTTYGSRESDKNLSLHAAGHTQLLIFLFFFFFFFPLPATAFYTVSLQIFLVFFV